MKLLSRLFHTTDSNGGQKKGRKVAALTIFTLFNIFSVAAASIAWFTMTTKGSKVSTVSGDLNVEIKKVVAYKYVYPFYDHSTEFIDYGSDGTIKGYTVEDAEITDTVSVRNATFTIGTTSGTKAATSEDASQTSVYHDDDQGWRYYLVGNSTFNGVEENEWCTSTAVPFNAKYEIDRDVVEIANIMVSVGSEFILFDAYTINGSSCSYLTYGDVEESGAPFKSLSGNRLKCLRAGLYTFRYMKVEGVTKLTIQQQARGEDYDSVIGNNILDPTKVYVDWSDGSVNHETFPSASSWMANGVFAQNTTVILDVTLGYKNVNPILAGLKILRNSDAAESIYSIDGRYNNTTLHTVGYVIGGDRNPLLASDFYTFYAVFSQENPFDSIDDLWEEMHQKTDKQTESVYDFCKFTNDGPSFDKTVPCDIHPYSGDTDDLIIPGTTTNVENIYHCYIAIDYDYEHSRFFMNSNRLNKTYFLDRDFGFRFIGTQQLES